MRGVVLDDKLADQVTQEAIGQGETGLQSTRGQDALAAARRVIANGFDFTTDDV